MREIATEQKEGSETQVKKRKGTGVSGFLNLDLHGSPSPIHAVTSVGALNHKMFFEYILKCC